MYSYFTVKYMFKYYVVNTPHHDALDELDELLDELDELLDESIDSTIECFTNCVINSKSSIFADVSRSKDFSLHSDNFVELFFFISL